MKKNKSSSQGTISLIVFLLLSIFFLSFVQYSSASQNTVSMDKSELQKLSIEELKEVPLEQWKEVLTEEEYAILWEGKTEFRFSGELLDHKENGTYVTAGCGIPVFRSDAKYDSGSGWPSFWDALNKSNIILREDNSLGQKRIEVLSACGEHLGHVFDDGPTETTGERYCINSAALDFVPDAS